jgi:hypothetical protein
MSSKTGRKRDIKDQFYTKPEVAKKCMNKVYELCSGNIFVEPSAGTGAFSDIVLEKENSILLAYDLEPKRHYIVEQDFLDKNLVVGQNDTITIGNPPFGRQGSLAKKFVVKCCEFSKYICFILPMSFKKPSMTKCFRKDFHKIYEHDVNDNSFLVEGKEYNVPCVFQIWERKEVVREVNVFQDNKYFDFVKKDQNPDYSIRRVGVYAGKIYEEVDKSIQSHYFIKVKDNVNKENFYNEYLSLVFNETVNTTGPRSVSKPELITTVNSLNL